MTLLLGFVAVVLGLVGVAASSQATLGVSTVAFACLLGIVARISQAHDQHRQK